MYEEIKKGNTIIAIIIRSGYHGDETEFFTPPEFSQQLGYLRYARGHRVPAHVHNKIERSVHHTLEVLFIRKGKLRLDLYDELREYIGSRVLEKGDVVLLSAGGHGSTMLEETEIIEVKQGPHAGEADKTRFEGVAEELTTAGV